MEILIWPAVVLILGIIALIFLRKPLVRFFDRAVEMKFGSAAVTAAQAPQESSKDIKAAPSDELLKAFDNALLIKNEDIIRKEFETRKITAQSDRERILIRYLSATALSLQFEKIYNSIWGSQISALQLLNTRGAGYSEEEVHAFYKSGKSNFPKMYEIYSFEQWLQFLESFSLIKRDGKSFVLTLEGREFLKYLIDQGHTFQKLG